MTRSSPISATGWFAILVINLLHYAVLGLLGCACVLMLLIFLTHDSDHARIRARIDHIYDVWTAPRGAAQKSLSSRGAEASEAAP